MSRIVQAVARVGGLADSVVRAGRALPSQVRLAWSARPYRRAGLAAGAGILLLYLTAIGDINAWGRPGRPGVDVAADWVAKLTATRAPYLFEPIAA
ncbi:MAG: hypothetical protein GEU94_16225, partial [Micromonosporaceae bacterium]|nr:hypothetical protein [Micromonosporaceae bacterium]